MRSWCRFFPILGTLKFVLFSSNLSNLMAAGHSEARRPERVNRLGRKTEMERSLDLPQGCDSAARQVLDRVSRIHSSLGVIFPRRFFSFFHALSSVYSLFVCLSRFLVILVFSAERVASIARVNSARRRNNNFGGSVSCGTRTRTIQRRSKLEAGKRATDNSKLQKTKPSNARHCPGPGFATRGASSTTPATRPSAHKQSASGQWRAARATRPTRPAQMRTRELSSCSTESSLPPPLDLPSARRPTMTHARP